MSKKRPVQHIKAHIKSVRGILKSASSVTDELLRERARDKKRESVKSVR
jgi:hypothetical protein